MTSTRFKATTMHVGMSILLFALPVVPAGAQDTATCNGFIQTEYVDPPLDLTCGDRVTVRITFGTGDISGIPIGGPPLVLRAGAFTFSLDCQNVSQFPCAAGGDDGAVIGFVPGSVTDDCPDTDWSTLHPGGAFPNEVDFLASAPGLIIPANQPIPPGACSVEFQVEVLSESPFGNPVEELVGYSAALCNNGILASSGSQSSSIVVECEEPNFDCYQVTQGAAPGNVKLVDRFTTQLDARLKEQDRVCPPANKNGEDPGAIVRLEHLTGYEIKKGADANASATVTNQFGTVSGEVKRAKRLLVPAAKALGKDVDPGPPPPNLSHYQCYDFEADVTDFTVTLQDQFIVLTSADPPVIDPMRMAMQAFARKLFLCVPVSKNDEPATLLGTGLLCYNRQKDNTVDIPQNLQVSKRDQFGLDGSLKVTQFEELCVTSTIAVP